MISKPFVDRTSPDTRAPRVEQPSRTADPPGMPAHRVEQPPRTANPPGMRAHRAPPVRAALTNCRPAMHTSHTNPRFQIPPSDSTHTHTPDSTPPAEPPERSKNNGLRKAPYVHWPSDSCSDFHLTGPTRHRQGLDRRLVSAPWRDRSQADEDLEGRSRGEMLN
jgi:hypothetical protein